MSRVAKPPSVVSQSVHHLSLCCRDSVVLILSPSLADRQVVSSTERLLLSHHDAETAEGAESVTWTEGEGQELNQWIRLKIQHPKVREYAFYCERYLISS